MIHNFTIQGVPLMTGDIICSENGKEDILPGQFWRLIGRLLPGEVDHVAIYLGPGGRCVEAGAKGVALFSLESNAWEVTPLLETRGYFVDSFMGAVYPLRTRGLTEEAEASLRETIAAYCEAQLGKPYNLNFFNPETEEAFYCSQLAYKAYQRVGINLNTGQGLNEVPGTEVIIYPQEIWSGFPRAWCSEAQARQAAAEAEKR